MKCLPCRICSQSYRTCTKLFLGRVVSINQETYSTDQMQGIKRVRFDRILIAFIASDERVYRQQRTHLLLAANTFIASDKRGYLWRRAQLAIKTNAFSAGCECVYRQRRTRLALETNAFKMHSLYTLHLISTLCNVGLVFRVKEPTSNFFRFRQSSEKANYLAYSCN